MKIPFSMFVVDDFLRQEEEKKTKPNPAPTNKYLREIKVNNNGMVDVYAVLVAFNVTCPARAHAIKKLLCAGQRGKGSTKQDLREASQAVFRAIELTPEEEV